ncbi:MAG: ABC transporter ATP-binding protein, partial [Lachnospiraceae bacterium]|nr:ABC transporter ATP-binding protein [Lachnospiraceae bacterium]
MIQVQQAVKRFGDLTALNKISCRIDKGSVYGLVGSNGAGKSTFLRLVSGVYKADEGLVTIDGAPVYDDPAVKSRLVFVPDELFFLPGSTLTRMAVLYKSFYPHFDEKRFHFLTNSFQLDEKRLIHGFSKGMRRQAATLLALSCRPDFYFFDETFDGLDPV